MKLNTAEANSVVLKKQQVLVTFQQSIEVPGKGLICKNKSSIKNSERSMYTDSQHNL